MRRQVVLKGQKRSKLAFFSEVIAELKKVAWPSRKEAIRLTLIVILITVAMGIILGIIDYGFSKFIDLVLLR